MGRLICEGKTKRIIESDQEGQVIIETKDDLTGGDAAKKETISGISTFKTKQTVDVFKLLEREGIPTAFIEQTERNKFTCKACDMLPLELVMRRYAWGSFLKRAPDLESTIEKPYRFEQIKTEFFHKHAVVVPPLVDSAVQMEEGAARDLYLKDGVWKEGVYTDPLLLLGENSWVLHPSKQPVDENNPLLTIPPALSQSDVELLINKIMLPTFDALERAWAKVETVGGAVALVDMKIEVGRLQKGGQLVVADVIDNDSWRIWPGADPRQQLDKQCFREDHPLNEVAEKYELVAQLTGQF